MTKKQLSPADEGDLFANERFSWFRGRLEEKGYFLKLMWSCNSGAYNPETGKKFKYANLGMFMVCGTPGGIPATVSTMVICSYGKDGFGLWLDQGALSMDHAIKKIIGGGAAEEDARELKMASEMLKGVNKLLKK
jgi:hypothetical protein